MRTAVLLLGTLDTKGEECDYVRRRLRALDCAKCSRSTSAYSGRRPSRPDVARAAVAQAAGVCIADLAARRDRGEAMDVMGRGATAVVRSLVGEGRLSAVFALGGSGGASVAARVMGALPIGFPKLLVSTVAAGDTRPYIHGDVTMLYPVVDLAGINPISARVLDNAAGAIAGMATAARRFAPLEPGGPLVGMTMFGITTPCVDRVRSSLAIRGYVPLVFSANGVGGDSMEKLVVDGCLVGVVDVTTTEIADRLVGGILAAGETRLEAAGSSGVPQVVSLGALDVVNFGPWDSVPPQFRHRRLYRHNPVVTLMRTSPEECAVLGHTIAAKLNRGRGRRAVVVSLRGLSALSAPGQPFNDPEADAALFQALRAELASDVELLELDAHINEPDVAKTIAETFHTAFELSRKESMIR